MAGHAYKVGAQRSGELVFKRSMNIRPITAGHLAYGRCGRRRRCWRRAAPPALRHSMTFWGSGAKSMINGIIILMQCSQGS
eukprot:6174744-Pleurochrysis_carterae.AAC.1